MLFDGRERDREVVNSSSYNGGTVGPPGPLTRLRSAILGVFTLHVFIYLLGSIIKTCCV